MKNTFKYLLPALLLLLSCSRKQAAISAEELMLADRAFSEYSEEHGMTAAFMEYADDKVVLLRANRLPIVGKAELEINLPGAADSSFVLSWSPLTGIISESGDLGYTYGTYLLTFKADSLPDEEGTYVTIWKKQADASWKFVLDTGQEGLGE